MAATRSGGRILIDQLVIYGVRRAFCVPGESYLAALDALYDTPSLQLIVCRMEAGAANMACAHGQLTGSPGVCFVTRGPGAAHAAVGVHTARQGSVPMLLVVGQVPRSHRGREAFQEIDIEAMFAPLAKWVASAEAPDQIPELVA
ncbi:MAG: thiamine pyrophosphate-binding protein, partial [Solirubrobacteraceae bacterium]